MVLVCLCQTFRCCVSLLKELNPRCALEVINISLLWSENGQPYEKAIAKVATLAIAIRKPQTKRSLRNRRLNNHAIGPQGCGSGALEISERLVVVSLGT